MRGEWLWTPTPAFLSMLRALPHKEEHQVLEKLKILELDPSPDGKAKKKLTHVGEDLYRLRCGDYRIFYTYRDPYLNAPLAKAQGVLSVPATLPAFLARGARLALVSVHADFRTDAL